MSIFEHLRELSEWKDDPNFMIKSILTCDDCDFDGENNRDYFTCLDFDADLNLNLLKFDHDKEEIKLVRDNSFIETYPHGRELPVSVDRIYRHGEYLYVYSYSNEYREDDGFKLCHNYNSLYELLKDIEVKKCPSTVGEILEYIKDYTLEGAISVLRDIFYDKKEIANKAYLIHADRLVHGNLPFK